MDERVTSEDGGMDFLNRGCTKHGQLFDTLHISALAPCIRNQRPTLRLWARHKGVVNTDVPRRQRRFRFKFQVQDYGGGSESQSRSVDERRQPSRTSTSAMSAPLRIGGSLRWVGVVMAGTDHASKH